MSLGERVTKSVSWLAVAQIARRAVTLVTTAILARLLLPEDFGLVNMAMIAVGFLSVINDVGLTSALIQRLEVDDEQLTAAFWLACGASLVATAAGALVAWPFGLANHEARVVPLVMVLLAILPVGALGVVADALLQRELDFKRIALVELSASLVAALLGVVLALAGAGVWSLVAQYLAVAVVTTGGKLIAVGWVPRGKFSARAARSLFGFSASVVGGGLVNYATRNADNMLIGGVLGVKALGYYSMAYTLVILPGQTVGGLVYIAGVTAPPGKKMGHAGAIVSGGKGTAAAKMEALADAGVKIGLNPTEAGELMVEVVASL